MVTFDLVVEGHCGIRDALPTDAVENSACHREAHHTEGGLCAKRNSIKCQNGVSMHKMYSYLQDNDKYYN